MSLFSQSIWPCLESKESRLEKLSSAACNPLVEKQRKEMIEGATDQLKGQLPSAQRRKQSAQEPLGCWLVERDWPTPSKLAASLECKPYLQSHEPN